MVQILRKHIKKIEKYKVFLLEVTVVGFIVDFFILKMSNSLLTAILLILFILLTIYYKNIAERLGIALLILLAATGFIAAIGFTPFADRLAAVALLLLTAIALRVFIPPSHN